MGSELTAHEAKDLRGCSLRGHEGERNNNCFSKIQLFGKKNIETKHLLLIKARLNASRSSTNLSAALIRYH